MSNTKMCPTCGRQTVPLAEPNNFPDWVNKAADIINGFYDCDDNGNFVVQEIIEEAYKKHEREKAK